MTINRALHQRANVAVLYLHGNTGGRGLRSAAEPIRTEEYGLSNSIKIEEKIFNRSLNGLIKERSKQEYKNERKENKEIGKRIE